MVAPRLFDMLEHDGLMRVFWPADLPRSDLKGVVVGWRNSALDVFVLAILDEVEVGAPQATVAWRCMENRMDEIADSLPAP